MKAISACPYVKSIIVCACIATAATASTNVYPWGKAVGRSGDIASRIPAPQGFDRVKLENGSFAEWLRHLPLKVAESPVLLFDGSRKPNQMVHAAVLDIDTGTRDLQQCADAVIRLRAEYLCSKGRWDSIRFSFTSGDVASYAQWRAGFRPEVRGNKIRWAKKAEPNPSYESFRRYLDTVFVYAGSQSLARELEPRGHPMEIQVGDVFIHGGSPGHAVIVVDMAEKKATGERVVLLAQSYMPAQDIHILRNPSNESLSPWYLAEFGETLRTPEWEFTRGELKHFKME